MGKRGNTNQLTKDDYEARGDADDDDGGISAPGEFEKASSEKLKGRRILKAGR